MLQYNLYETEGYKVEFVLFSPKLCVWLVTTSFVLALCSLTFRWRVRQVAGKHLAPKWHIFWALNP